VAPRETPRMIVTREAAAPRHTEIRARLLPAGLADRTARWGLGHLGARTGPAARVAPRNTEPAAEMSDLSGTHGLIVGIANKWSIAWAVAKAAARDGARLAITYQGERFADGVRELARELDEPLLLPCDVTSDAQVADLFHEIDRQFGGLDFVLHGAAFAPREELSRPFVETSREGFRIALDVSAYSLITLSRGAAPLLARRGGGSIVTLTYLGSQRVFPNYNVMGSAKAASMRCRPARSGLWPPRASQGFRESCRSTATGRPLDETSRWTRSPRPCAS
jgi:hypothetical protein